MHGPRCDRFPLIATTSITLWALLLCVPHFSAAAGIDADLPRVRAAAERGYVQDEIALGAAYFTGKGVAQDLKQAAYWYEKAAGSGDPAAQNQIGYFYQAGIGVAKDAQRAAHWYQLASAGGLKIAKVNLGVAYTWGIGVTKNPHLAEQLFREAANGGFGPGAVYLGDMYYMGVGLPQDKSAGEQWYEKGVKLHNYLAEYRMGFILSQTEDHKKDFKRAVELFRESAAAGFVPAMHSLGLLLVNHPELEGTKEEALNRLEQAADAGFWRSSIVLGVLARDGRLISPDAHAAYLNFQKAADAGGDQAKSMLRKDFEILSKKLSSEERAKLDTKASQWAAKHHDGLELIYKGGEDAGQFPAFALAAAPDDVHAGPLIPKSPF
jgi:TPR repeat protein